MSMPVVANFGVVLPATLIFISAWLPARASHVNAALYVFQHLEELMKNIQVHTVEFKDFDDFVAETVLARGSGKTLKVLVNIKSNDTMYSVEDAEGVMSIYETPGEAIRKYNTAKAAV